MKIYLCLPCAIIIAFSASCSTLSSTSIASKLNKIESLRLGSSTQQAQSILGPPDKTETEGPNSIWTYTVKFESKHGVSYLPEIVLNFSSEGILISKDFNLFQEKVKISAAEIKSRYRSHNFVTQYPENWGKTHSFSSLRYLIDESAGISIRYNVSRADEVASIYWYSPRLSKNTVTPAKN